MCCGSWWRRLSHAPADAPLVGRRMCVCGGLDTAHSPMACFPPRLLCTAHSPVSASSASAYVQPQTSVGLDCSQQESRFEHLLKEQPHVTLYILLCTLPVPSALHGAGRGFAH